jgi:hypothetical protein
VHVEQHDVGYERADRVDRAATSLASPTMSNAAPISARTPERTTAWSSTTNTRIRPVTGAS